jgi:exonuclease SbcD
MAPPRVLHTADWHLGRRLNRAPRVDEQERLLSDLVAKARTHDPEVVAVAGDVFDFFNPTARAETLYYETLRALADGGERAVVVVAGNHDSPHRLTAPKGLLEDAGVLVAGDPHDPDDAPEPRTHPGFEVAESGPGWVRLVFPDRDEAVFHLLPFPADARVPTRVAQGGEATAGEVVEALQGDLPETSTPTYLVSHLYVQGGAGVAEDREDYVGGAYAVDPALLDRYEAAFLGHLHVPHGGETWRYAGAPLAFDFDDPEAERGGWLWDDGGWTKVPLSGGRDLRVEDVAGVTAATGLAEDVGDAWVRLRFPPGTVLAPSDRERVREAFGDRLVDIQFEPPEEAGPDGGRPLDPGNVDPEEAFRAYHEDETGDAPDDELVDLFLDLVAEGEA